VKSFNEIKSQTGLMGVAQKAIFLLAAFLVAANAQCVANCSTTECSHPVPQSRDSDKLPPCHRHHAPKQSTVAKPCIDSVVVVDSRSTSLSLERHSFEPLVAASGVASSQPLPTLAVHAPSAASPPTQAKDRSPLILRI